MPIPVSIIGRSTAPVTHELDAEWLAGFATSVGDTQPGDGLTAHPLFPVCIEWPSVIAAARLDDGALTADERRRGVHATHDLTIHRPLRADDVLTTTATVEALEPRRRGTMERLRLDTRDAAGALVTTTVMGSLFLGVEIDGAQAPPNPKPDRAATAPPTEAIIELAVAADQAHVYSEGSRIWNPIHTDATAAQRAGLPEPILHGTCTLAMATSAALDWARTADEAIATTNAVHRVHARFAGMVLMPSTLALHVARPSARELRFEVFDGHGVAVVRGGLLTLTI